MVANTVIGQWTLSILNMLHLPTWLYSGEADLSEPVIMRLMRTA